MLGSGWVTRGSYRAAHWDRAKAREGIKAWYVWLDWEDMVPLGRSLSREHLLAGILPANLINAQSSGITVGPEFVENLEERWAAHLKKPLGIPQQVLSGISAWEGQPIEYRGYRRKRDQRLKREALVDADGICAVCSVDYKAVLGGKGVRVLQVHHKNQLSQKDTPKLNTVADLAVVCANCHALIHLNRKQALTVGALKALLKNSQKRS